MTKLSMTAVIVWFFTATAAFGQDVPPLDEYCKVAQRVVTQTELPVNLHIHKTFDGFVKSKAVIPEGDDPVPEIQQLNWADADGDIVGVSCKLKSADHLNLVYGDGTAGPDGACQDMNKFVFQAMHIPESALAYDAVVFDPTEQPQTRGITPIAGGPGPQWLQPYVATEVDDSGALVIKTKGFVVDFTDPRYARAPARFRGVHYCHFIAPAYLRAVATGAARPGVTIGQVVDVSKYAPPGE